MKKSNKLTALAAALVCGVCAAPISSFATEATTEFDVSLIQKYDFNLDGDFTSADSKLILEYYASNQSGQPFNYSDEIKAYIENNADVTNDGLIDAADAATILTSLKNRYDFNLDGNTNMMDITIILNYYSDNQTGRLESGTSNIPENCIAYITAAGNIVSDGLNTNVDAMDASFLLNEFAEVFNIKRGDADGNGIVDAMDAAKLLDCYAKLSTGNLATSDKEYQDLLALGDANADGRIDSTDSALTLDTYAQSMINQ